MDNVWIYYEPSGFTKTTVESAKNMGVSNYTSVAPDKTLAKPHFNTTKNAWEDLSAPDVGAIQQQTGNLLYQSMTNNANYHEMIGGLVYQLMSGGNN